jgi:2-keto-3-deoxy-L-rhamnonate aldolase RhmA
MATDGAVLHAVIAAPQGGGRAPPVRVPGHAPGPVKPARDAGAARIVSAPARDAAGAEARVAATRDPRRGVPAGGPSRPMPAGARGPSTTCRAAANASSPAL